jgi:predicted DsbA family dithiol-disulfide isomerase
MRVDVWGDLVCPWCYVGKRRFERAAAAFAHPEQLQVVFHAFELDPRAPVGTRVRQVDVLVARYGMSEAQAIAVESEMERTAAAEGLEFNLDGAVSGNTFDAHRLVQLAKDRGIQEQVVERFYRAHFTELRSLFDQVSLLQLATEAGLDGLESQRVLRDGGYAEAVLEDERQARTLGATGVPFFVVAERYGISGAQPTDVFGEALQRAWKETSPDAA